MAIPYNQFPLQKMEDYWEFHTYSSKQEILLDVFRGIQIPDYRDNLFWSTPNNTHMGRGRIEGLVGHNIDACTIRKQKWNS